MAICMQFCRNEPLSCCACQVEESSEVPSPTTPDRHTGVDASEAQDPSVVLSEAAKKAFMCYQRSAAEAAAHPSTAEPAAEQATPLPVSAVLHIRQSQ